MLRRQRRRRKHTIIGVTVFLVVVNIVVGTTVAYLRRRVGQIERVTVRGLARDAPGKVMNVLLVITDEHARRAAIQGGSTGAGAGMSIMVLHVDPKKAHGAVLSIPADLYLPIAGTDGSDRIDSAFAMGGAQRLVRSVQASGIQVNHYAQFDVAGVKDLVNALGGVSIYLPNPARDLRSGLELPKAGCARLDGARALAWARSQSFEYLSNGKWTIDGPSELGLIERRQDLVRQVIRRAASARISRPLALNRLIGVGIGNLTLDSGMSTGDMRTVAHRFRSADSDSVVTATVAATRQLVDGQEVVVPLQPQAQADVDWVDGRTGEPPPAAVPEPAPTAPATSTTSPARGAAGVGSTSGVSSTTRGSTTTKPSATTTTTPLLVPTSVPSDAVPRRPCG